MAENCVVRARIDKRTKNQATKVLAAMGMTVSDAFHLMMTRIAKDKALPFEPVPNVETVKAMKAARRGKLVTAASPDRLLASLNDEDRTQFKRRGRRVVRLEDFTDEEMVRIAQTDES